MSAKTKSPAPAITKGIVVVKANLIDEATGTPSNQEITIVLPIAGKRMAKNGLQIFGYLDEFEQGKKFRYPLYGECSKKEDIASLDMGSGLEDDETPEGRNEKFGSPAGYRYFSLKFSDEVQPEKLFTITGGKEERDVYKISTVTEYK